jgi:hypothetical protein
MSKNSKVKFQNPGKFRVQRHELDAADNIPVSLIALRGPIPPASTGNFRAITVCAPTAPRQTPARPLAIPPDASANPSRPWPSLVNRFNHEEFTNSARIISGIISDGIISDSHEWHFPKA